MSIDNLQPHKGKNGKNRLYKCIFFDLDHTLWDYEVNARETLLDLHTTYNLLTKGISFEDFHQHFKTINFQLWDQYDRGLIDNEIIRTQRFKQVLEPFKAYEEKLCADLSYEYLQCCPKKANLVPFAKEVLDYLSANYALTIVTNGFEETQSVKLLSGNITHYFDHVITSQRAGHKKPSREIFDYALSLNNLQCHEVIMIGDNLITDMGGARNAGIDTVFYNPAGVAHSSDVKYEIRSLSELQNIL
jgi:putative hydrolase of the HAD superfamily